ncbi:hypothetical protein GGQ92_000633 [Gracilibacillus halotolerans]|uniref:YcxB-like C-terminal domain-containing protein n=1 Tax=Gracilibacillus halotolerans TaxID=74386 RepID=A0A841RK54_9BACI|nr:YcxB family protein [Gracilibacillus halotolerans]MBB6511866.1 hypothetical protein [Gracilibacillus halotolerans]
MDNNKTNEIYASGTYSKVDVVQLYAFQFRKIFVVLFLVTLFFCLLPLYVLLDIAAFIIISPIVLIFVWLYIIILKLIFKFGYRKQYNNNSFLTLQREFIITNVGITQKIPNKSYITLKWSDIVKGFELDKMFVLYISNNTSLLLPKSFFDSKDDELLVKQMAKENLSIKFKRKFI